MVDTRRWGRTLELAAMLASQRDVGEIRDIVRDKGWSRRFGLGLARDLAIPFPAPDATIPISIRPINEHDRRALLDVRERGISIEERRDRTLRMHIATAGFKTCFVAVTEDGEPCFMQWMITPDENDLLRRCFSGLFPPLAPNEVLLEGAYTPEAFRGRRIMPAAMARIAECARDLGYERVVTIVGQGNTASMKGCQRAGFTPYLVRQERWRLMRHDVSFKTVPAGTAYPHDGGQEPSTWFGVSPRTAGASSN